MGEIVKNDEQPIDRLEETKKVVAALKEQNEVFKKQIEEFKVLEANKLLEGETTAGRSPEVKREPTSKEYADGVMSGKIKPTK